MRKLLCIKMNKGYVSWKSFSRKLRLWKQENRTKLARENVVIINANNIQQYKMTASKNLRKVMCRIKKSGRDGEASVQCGVAATLLAGGTM